MHLNTPKHKLLTMMLAVIALSLAAASTASASKSQLSVIEEPTRILNPDPAAQSAALDEMKALGADIVKIPVLWRSVAPDGESTSKPAADLSNPDNYPAGAWATLDNAVAGANARGLQVWLMITAPAPRWAVAKETSPGPGANNPDVKEFAKFTEAVGKRFPSVRFYSIWNEPNLIRFISPQRAKGVIVSAIYYRDLYREGRNGLVAAGRSSATIMFGELLPNQPNPSKGAAVVPWLQTFFCLDKNGKKLAGKPAKAAKCSGYKQIKSSAFAYHPYFSRGGSPLTKVPAKTGSAPIGYLKRVEKVLDQAAKTKRLNKRKIKIYSSEFGTESSPPDPYGVTMTKIPFNLNASEYLSWVDSRVATYSQYLIYDDADIGFFQTGLRTIDGQKKPGVYEAYETPMMVFKGKSSSKVTVWGALRTKQSGAAIAEIQTKNGSSWTTVAQVPVSSATGYFQRNLSLSGAWGKTYRVSWTGGVSRTSKPGKLIKPYTN